MKKNKNIIYILIIAFLAITPFLFRGYTVGHDTDFHIGNIMAITEQIKKNFLFPSKIIGDVANNFGYGTRLFYPNLPHLTASYINYFINNPIGSMIITYFITLLASGLAMYFLSKRISENDNVALVSSIIYMLFPYHLSNIYIRDAFSENYLFVFLPIIILGLYELLKGNKKKFYILFVIGYVAGILTHLTLMIYFTIIILIILIMKYKFILKNIKELIIASFLILFISSPFIVPTIEQKLLGNYLVFQDGVMVQGTWGNGIIPYDFINYSTAGNGSVYYFIDIVSLVLLILTLTNYKKIDNKFYKYVGIFGIISLFISTKLFMWDLFPKSFRIFQFPWRFLTFASLSISLIAPLYLKKYKNIKMPLIIISIITLFSFSLMNFSNYNFLSLDDDNIDSINEKAMGAQKEYLPVNTFKNYSYFLERGNDIKIISGDGKATSNYDNVPYLNFKIEGNAIIELPRLYYVGYTLKDDEGNKYEIYENSNGFIECNLKTGIYHLQYTGTLIDKNCYFISLSGIIILVLIWRFYENKSNNSLLQ